MEKAQELPWPKAEEPTQQKLNWPKPELLLKESIRAKKEREEISDFIHQWAGRKSGGLTTQFISEMLGLPPRTVRRRITRILSKEPELGSFFSKRTQAKRRTNLTG